MTGIKSREIIQGELDQMEQSIKTESRIEALMKIGKYEAAVNSLKTLLKKQWMDQGGDARNRSRRKD